MLLLALKEGQPVALGLPQSDLRYLMGTDTRTPFSIHVRPPIEYDLSRPFHLKYLVEPVLHHSTPQLDLHCR